MEANKFDKKIKDKLINRTIIPSASAWERLSVQLDEHKTTKKRGWIFYIGIAASIVLLFAIGLEFLSSSSLEILPNDELVVSPTDQKQLENKIDAVLKNEIQEETVIVNHSEKDIETKKQDQTTLAHQQPTNSKTKTTQKMLIAKVVSKDDSIKNETIYSVENADNEFVEMPIDSDEKQVKKSQNLKSSIRINPDDLLYTVTHSPEKDKSYYTNYEIKRDEVLKLIKNELKKSDIKMNPETLLAEIERSVFEEQFDSNFIKLVKEKVTLLASTIANRNYKDN